MLANESGSVRVDLLGGTLDISPINLVLENVITLNFATSLKAEVQVQSIDKDILRIISSNYAKTYEFQAADFKLEKLEQTKVFKEMELIAKLVHYFEQTTNLEVEISSKVPAGSGLGGSSALAITTFKALAKFHKKNFSNEQIIKIVKNIEAQILDAGPTGYQDYYPACYGGILALKAHNDGVIVEQLYSEEIIKSFADNLTLAYSGKSRNSGINNWEVFKAFFDRKLEVRDGLSKIAELSYLAYHAIKQADFEKFYKLIKLEGEVRVSLFKNIVTDEMKSLLQDLKMIDSSIGMKVCGAGGGGSFLIIHAPEYKEAVQRMILKHEMEIQNFSIEAPIDQRL